MGIDKEDIFREIPLQSGIFPIGQTIKSYNDQSEAPIYIHDGLWLFQESDASCCNRQY